MAIGGIGVYLLCRDLGISRGSAMLAGAGFMLGGTFSPRINGGQTTMIAGWAWLPLALLFAFRTCAQRRWLPHPGLPLVLALSFLAGHSQVTLYTVVAVACLDDGLAQPLAQHIARRTKADDRLTGGLL